MYCRIVGRIDAATASHIVAIRCPFARLVVHQRPIAVVSSVRDFLTDAQTLEAISQIAGIWLNTLGAVRDRSTLGDSGVIGWLETHPPRLTVRCVCGS
jgi:hypothetical protein